MTHDFHKLWLKVAAIVVASFGPVFLLGTMEATAEPARFTLDLLKWPLDGLERYDAPEIRFLSALAGGFLLGWGVVIWRLSGDVYDAAPAGVRKAVVAGFLVWFAIDSAGSVLSGAASNVIPNIAVLLLGVGPLWRPATGWRDRRA